LKERAIDAKMQDEVNKMLSNDKTSEQQLLALDSKLGVMIKEARVPAKGKQLTSEALEGLNSVGSGGVPPDAQSNKSIQARS